MSTKRKIKATIVADSTDSRGNRAVTYILQYPRFIHAELLTHRMFSRNAASSRAIPALKMIEDVENAPFIPIAWQKAHKGMQGTEYFTTPEEIEVREYAWLTASEDAITNAKQMLEQGVTKQLINRLLEPFQWYTCLVTATEYDNFFELRCPQYKVHKGEDAVLYKSWKDCAKEEPMIDPDTSDLYKLQYNVGQGEIHISLLAEAMWDARNESTPKQLKAGEWHIPDFSKINSNSQ